MPKVFPKSICSFMTVMLLFSIINIGCSSRVLEQRQQNALEQPEKKEITMGTTNFYAPYPFRQVAR